MPDRNADIILRLSTQQFTSALAGTLTPLGALSAALQAIPAIVDWAEEGAKVQRTAAAFDGLAKSAGTSGDALTVALRKASGGEVSDFNLQLEATKAEFTGVAKNADDFGRLMAIARNNGREFGLSTQEAFDKLTEALDRGQARGLKQIGINVDLREAERTYAASIGVTVASLDEEQKRQALVQATLQQGEAQLKRTGGAANDNAAAFDRAGAAASNVKDALGSFLSGVLAPTAAHFADTVEATQKLVDWTKQLGTTVPGTDAALAAFDAEMQKSGDATKAEAAYQEVLAAALAKTAPAANDASTAILRSADADDRAADAATRHAAALVKETSGLLAVANATALADQRKGEQTGTDLSAGEFNKFADIAAKARSDKVAADKVAQDKAAAESQRIQSAQDQLNLARAKTSAQKIAELQREQRAATDPADKLRLEAQIEQERNSQAKGHTTELGKQLKLHEGIYDSINKQRDAELSLQEEMIKGRQADRDAVIKDRTAQRVIAALGGRTDERANDLRGRAEDVIALDAVERQKRAQQEAEKGATAGGSIIGGKVYQSVPQSGGATPVQAGVAGPSPAPAFGGGSGLFVTVNIDGKAAWSGMASYAWADLMQAVHTQKARVGG